MPCYNRFVATISKPKSWSNKELVKQDIFRWQNEAIVEIAPG